ncbi:TPA: hypothetical protein L9K94_001167 [Klebsiella pneumoniae]|nr:hypothetical protein [Klebsiella pneumoniae]
MSNLEDKPLFEDVFKLENDTPAEAITSDGDISYANIQAQILANRTRYLKEQLDAYNGLIKSGELPFSDSAAANDAIVAGRIPEGGVFSVRSTSAYYWAEEFKNVAGEIVSTGKLLPSDLMVTPLLGISSSDPDGTITGLAVTNNEQYFGVIQDAGNQHPVIYYKNANGIAVKIESPIGLAVLKNNVREYTELITAQRDTDLGVVPDGFTCWVTNSSDNTLADEYINVAGTLTATGRKMPSADSVNNIYATLSPAIQLINAGELADISTASLSLNQLALGIRSLYSQSAQAVASTGETVLNIVGTSAVFFDSISTASATSLLTLSASNSTGSLFEFKILPHESVTDGILTTPFRNRIFTADEVTDVTQEASVVRVRMLLALDNQYTSSGEFNIFDKHGVFAPTSQALASTRTALSVSTHSAGGIQLMIPTTDITGAGYTVDLASVKAYIRDKLGPLSLWYRTSVNSTRNVAAFFVAGPGTVSVIADAGVTISAVVYSASSASPSGDYAKEASLKIETLHRKYREYSSPFAVKKLADQSLNTPAESIVSLINVNTPENNNAGYYTVEFKDADDVVQGRLFWPAALTNYDNGKFYSPYGLFDFLALDFVSASIRDTVAVAIYSNPDVRISVSASAYTVIDINGAFSPATSNGANSATSLCVAGTSETRGVQFVVPVSALTNAGYAATTDTIADDVQAYLSERANASLFAGFRSGDSTIAQDGFSDYFRLRLPAGDYTVVKSSTTSSGWIGGSYSVMHQPVTPPVYIGLRSRLTADVKNELSMGYSNYPIELKASFPVGAVPSSSCLIVKDSDGNEYPAQFADEFYPNLRAGINTGYHADNSLAAGSVFIMDTLATGEQKFYELLAYNRAKNQASEVHPQLVKITNGYQITVDGYVFAFTRQFAFGLATITDPTGTVHNINHAVYFSEVVSAAGVDVLMNQFSSFRLVNTGPVFSEIELVVLNPAGANVPAGVLEATIRYRIYKNGKVRLYVMTKAVSEIAAGLLYGVTSRVNFADGSYTYDATWAQCYWTDSVSSKKFSASVGFSNGDIHRDGTTYGPTRPVYATVLNPSGSTTRMYAGWRFTSVTDTSFTDWLVDKDWTWSHMIAIDCDNSMATMSASNLASQTLNAPVGYLGHCGFPAAKVRKIMSLLEEHLFGSLEWWESSDSVSSGGGASVTNSLYSHTGDIAKAVKSGNVNLNTLYNNFSSYMATYYGSITGPGPYYTSGTLQLQFASRLVIPVYEWLYKLAVSAGDTEKQTALKAGIGSLASAMMTYYNAQGGINLRGNLTGQGNSNSNATGLRTLALAIYMGLDTDGTMLAAFNAIETMLTASNQFMMVQNIPSDAFRGRVNREMYLHYQVYAANNYLFACKLLGRTPAFDLVNFIISATGGMGGFKEIDFCISESRRGDANTISFALFPLMLSGRASGVNAAEKLIDNFTTQYGAKPGYPLRFFDFDGVTATSALSSVSFVATTLADIWLHYNFA